MKPLTSFANFMQKLKRAARQPNAPRRGGSRNGPTLTLASRGGHLIEQACRVTASGDSRSTLLLRCYRISPQSTMTED